MEVEKVYLELHKRIKELEDAIFKYPAVDMIDYTARRGAWVALTDLRDWINQRVRNDDDDPDE